MLYLREFKSDKMERVVAVAHRACKLRVTDGCKQTAIQRSRCNPKRFQIPSAQKFGCRTTRVECFKQAAGDMHAFAGNVVTTFGEERRVHECKECPTTRTGKHFLKRGRLEAGGVDVIEHADAAKEPLHVANVKMCSVVARELVEVEVADKPFGEAGRVWLKREEPGEDRCGVVPCEPVPAECVFTDKHLHGADGPFPPCIVGFGSDEIAKTACVNERAAVARFGKEYFDERRTDHLAGERKAWLPRRVAHKSLEARERTCHCVPGFVGERQAVLRGKTQRAQDTQRVVRKSTERIAWRADAPGVEVAYADAKRVFKDAVAGAVAQTVDGEVFPFVRRGGDGDSGTRSVCGLKRHDVVAPLKMHVAKLGKGTADRFVRQPVHSNDKVRRD